MRLMGGIRPADGPEPALFWAQRLARPLPISIKNIVILFIDILT